MRLLTNVLVLFAAITVLAAISFESSMGDFPKSEPVKSDKKIKFSVKVMKDVMTPTGVQRVVITELINPTPEEYGALSAKIRKEFGIQSFQCKACTSWKADDGGSGQCSRTCCYPGPSGCLVYFIERAECCALPNEELPC